MRASDRAYAVLREDILEWRLAPGTVLAEVEQSERLGVSRTPVREALSRLTAEGLTAPHGGRGVVVTDISLDHLGELFELREALECKAAALAAERRDPEIFRTLAAELVAARNVEAVPGPSRQPYYALVSRLDEEIDSACASAYLVQALRQLRVHLVRVRRLSRDNPERLAAAALEHATIASAIAAGNASLATAATQVHLHNSLHHLSESEHTP
ncbi:MAG: GntR family transcriptional regulator [Actinomycetales bacterium]|jgi:DNA-binding GntR family transcriptional regulator